MKFTAVTGMPCWGSYIGTNLDKVTMWRGSKGNPVHETFVLLSLVESSFYLTKLFFKASQMNKWDNFKIICLELTTVGAVTSSLSIIRVPYNLPLGYPIFIFRIPSIYLYSYVSVAETNNVSLKLKENKLLCLIQLIWWSFSLYYLS